LPHPLRPTALLLLLLLVNAAAAVTESRKRVDLALLLACQSCKGSCRLAYTCSSNVVAPCRNVPVGCHVAAC
jgi:hypothetical protein